MKKINHYLLFITLGLIILIAIEGLVTLGSAFHFAEYNAFSWIAQTLFVLFTISVSIKMGDAELE